MNQDQDPHRGRGGRYRIDEDGNRVPVDPVAATETPADPVKKPASPVKPKRSK